MSSHSSVNDDYEFVDLVYDDVKKFLANPHGERALLFPAVNPRRRYLIHNTVQENFPHLTTLSVGQGDQRRTAVTFRNNFNSKGEADARASEAESKSQPISASSTSGSHSTEPCSVGSKIEESSGRLASGQLAGRNPSEVSNNGTNRSQDQTQGPSSQQSSNSTSAGAAQEQSLPRKQEEKGADRPVREGRRPEQLLYSPQRQGSQQKIDIRRETLQQSSNRQAQQPDLASSSQRQQLQRQRSQDLQQQSASQQKQISQQQQQQSASQQKQISQQRQQHRPNAPAQPPISAGVNNKAQEDTRADRLESAGPPRPHHQQQQKQLRQRKHRSRSCTSDTRSSSVHSTVEGLHDRLGQEDDLMRDSGAEETQHGNASSNSSSRKRRNRRNRRHKERVPLSSAADQGGGTRPHGRELEGDKAEASAVATAKTASAEARATEQHNNIHNLSAGNRSVDVVGEDNVQKGVVDSETNPVSHKGRDLHGRAVQRSSERVASNSASVTGGLQQQQQQQQQHPANRRKYMKSYEEGENWRDVCGTNRRGSTRSPASSRRESESSSPFDTLAKNSPERMPVTVPSASEQGNNRRRAKAPAQIYRPPPARSSKEAPQQSQQPMQSHQPLYSQPYQPKPNFSQAPYHPQHHYSPNYHQQNATYLSQHNPHQQDFHPYNMIPNRQRTDSESSTATTSGDYLKDKGKGRRPDQVLYIPRGRRHAPDPSSARGTPTPVLDYESNGRPPSPAYSVCSVASEYSGRNRYNKPGSRQGSQVSICEGETDRLHGKPPMSRDFSRESTPGYGRQKNNPTLFSSQTLQLIERCLNHDADQRYNEYSNGESDAIHGSPSPKNKFGGGRALKSPTPTRDIHSIHSKENVIHPVDPSPRSRRSRKNRRRNSRSRDTSAEQLKDGQGKGRANHSGENNSPGERGMGSCERIFYNSNFNSSQDRYDRGYDNYDRYSSINSSRASSRNSSRERTPQYSPQHNWRVGSNPPSPTKGPVAYHQNRQSPGKPPSGRLGSLPNVALDFGESPRRVSNYNEENQRYHTLPVKSKTPVRSNSLQTEDTSDCIMSERINTNADSVEAGVDLIHQNEKSLENLKDEMTKNLINASSSSAHNESLNHEVSRNTEIRQCPENGPAEKMEEDVTIDSRVSKGLLSKSAEDSKIDGQKETKDDVMNKSVDAITSGTASEEDAYEMEAEASLTESAKDSTEEVTSSDNDTRDSLLESINEANDGERNIKKFQFNWADEVEDSWDSLYDDNGECLHSDIKRQLSDSLGKIKLEKPANDYYSFQPKEIEINEEEYGHVIEIYDFPVAFKTQDLMMVFSSFHNTGFDIKWVDDTHALGIFASALIAAEALSIDHPFLKTRSLASATKSSKAKALRITEALLPYKPRPATSASLARRLVSGALGLKVNISREVREAEKQKLKDAKARKRLAAKQRADAWEGTLS